MSDKSSTHAQHERTLRGGRVWKGLFVSVALLLLLVAGYGSARRGISSVAELLVQEHLSAWTESGELPKYQDWRRVADYFGFAYRLNPANPALLQLGGKLHEWGYLVATTGDLAVDDALSASEQMDQSLDYSRKGLALRPTWPYAWLDLTAAKVRFMQIDDEFQQAFASTLRFGFWDRNIQKGILPIGFTQLPLLNVANKTAFWELAKALSTRKPRELVQAAANSGKLALVCAGFQSNGQIAPICKAQGYRF